MEMQENMAFTIRLMMEQKHQTLQEFSEELEISRSMLQEYLNGTGNPSIKTVAHMAEKLGIDPVVLLTGMAGIERQDILLLLLDTLRGISELSSAKKQEFAKLMQDMVQIWSDAE